MNAVMQSAGRSKARQKLARLYAHLQQISVAMECNAIDMLHLGVRFHHHAFWHSTAPLHACLPLTGSAESSEAWTDVDT